MIDQLLLDAQDPARGDERASVPSAAPAPRPARASAWPAPPRTRRPWASVALFSAMLALSVVPLLRYALSREDPRSEPPTRVLSAAQAPVSTPEPQADVRAANDSPPSTQTPDAGLEQQLVALIATGNRALEEGAIADAERLFGRVVELDEDNPHAAYGLSRVRLTQGNLSGAEGWIQLALRKRPRRRAYHALYAQVLMRLGRTHEAHEEERQAALPEAEDGRLSAPRDAE